ncbi:hypothetical protein MTR_4g098780 [Medicago truncatula]|uniref:Uncharacterized protein n=1 Tax=Medicago truncatula TaxID=3880 RepID=G7JHM3_MEDTR|nr:hypothetical protein MTR_4g098780 [Medicago truncatula]
MLLPRVSLFQSLPELIFDICFKESVDTGGCIAVLLWQLWATRNDVVWNSSRDTPLEIGRLALSNWQQWKFTQEIRWEKPANGWLKCNVDVAFNSSIGISTTCCCFRNAEGVFFAGHLTKIYARVSVLEGEAMTCRKQFKLLLPKVGIRSYLRRILVLLWIGFQPRVVVLQSLML